MFFNIDCHVSVIEDVSLALARHGYDVDSHLLSGHHWTLGKPRASMGTGPGVEGKVGYGSINLTSWERLIGERNDSGAIVAAGQRFHDENPRLDNYTGFIATYPPAFALLYEKFLRPILVVMPIRYDHMVTGSPEIWRKMNDFLCRGIQSGRITVIGNNQFDAKYFEYFTGQPVSWISSTCDYIDSRAPHYDSAAVHEDYFLAFGEHPGCRAAQAAVPGVHFFVDHFNRAYRHEEIPKAKGVVWIPYNASIMSFFEHYRLCIPLFCPTREFLVALWEKELAMTQHNWHPSPVGGSNLPRAGTDMPDPTTAEGFRAWLQYSDFYNEEELPHVVRFSSWADLREKLVTADLANISAKMVVANAVREARNQAKWKLVVAKIEAYQL